MYLHKDKELLKETFHKCHEEKGISLGIIEKDYYVSMMLKGVADSGIGFIFKGGTSLSKCYKVIERFSEDIDLTVAQRPTQGQRYDMANAVMDMGNKIGLVLQNREEIRRRRDFNRYIFEYESIIANSYVKPLIIVEVYVALLAFPTTIGSIDSYVGQTLAKHDTRIAAEFGLLPFDMSVQDIRRTFVDKVFAICDYYLAGKSERYSRHIYDIYQILKIVNLEDLTKDFVAEVRQVRKEIMNCESAKDGINPTELLQDIVDKKFFERDYEQITKKLLFTYVPYSKAISSIEKIIASRCFTP